MVEEEKYFESKLDHWTNVLRSSLLTEYENSRLIAVEQQKQELQNLTKDYSEKLTTLQNELSEKERELGDVKSKLDTRLRLVEQSLTFLAKRVYYIHLEEKTMYA
jgi:regulator of sigma D